GWLDIEPGRDGEGHRLSKDQRVTGHPNGGAAYAAGAACALPTRRNRQGHSSRGECKPQPPNGSQIPRHLLPPAGLICLPTKNEVAVLRYPLGQRSKLAAF